MNTASSGSGRVDDIKGHPQGEIRGATKLVKPEMRHKLAQLPFEEKIRKVGELIRLSRKLKAQRIREAVESFPKSGFRIPQSIEPPPKK